MKNKYKIIIAVILLLTAFFIIKDWEHFRAGLFGTSPKIEIQE